VSTLELSPELSAVLEENEQWRQFADWLPQERAAFRPPEKLGVSEWADRHRVLPTKNQAEPGPWETSRTPYLREIMDAMHEPEVREITFLKSTQVGGTEALLNCLGWAIDQDPDPAVCRPRTARYLLPRQDTHPVNMNSHRQPVAVYTVSCTLPATNRRRLTGRNRPCCQCR
jgi:phage terminase large subunit GpA-like protein